MSYLKNKVQSYSTLTKQYYLIDTSVPDWKLLASSSTPFKRVKQIYRKSARIDELEVAGVIDEEELAKLSKELGLEKD